jgi:hypothetical protein
MRRMRITAGDIPATAVLNDTQTADAIWEALPITARANTWGNEIYFAIPVYLEGGTLGSGGSGRCRLLAARERFLHLFGRTPHSRATRSDRPAR